MDAAKANRVKSKAPLKPAQALRAALGARGGGVGTITYVYSSKNELDLVVPSDLQFALALLLEADERVKSWINDKDRVVALIEGEGYVGSRPDAIVTYWSGNVRYVEAKYTKDLSKTHTVFQTEAQRRAAELVGAQWTVFTEKDALAQARLMHDWLHIAPVLHATTHAVKAQWDWLSSSVLKAAKGGTTLGELRAHAKDPWDLVFSTTFRLVQRGHLRSDLADNPLSPSTVVAIRERRGG